MLNYLLFQKKIKISDDLTLISTETDLFKGAHNMK
jgi:hypothetical protein